MSRKLEQKQERRRAEQARRDAQRRAARRGNLVTVTIALVVVVVVVGLVVQDRFVSSGPVGTDVAAANCSEVETFEEEGRDHVDVGTTVDYATTPPTSGPHYPTPADPGFYTAPVPEETLVHNLEHGQIVIWYRPEAPAETIEYVQAVVEQQPSATLAAPYEGLAAPYNLALTAWGASELCEDISQAKVDDFRARFQGRGPENAGVPTFQPSG